MVILQRQNMTMSPRLYQGMKLLAYPMRDLLRYINETVEKNPALDIVGSKDLSLESLVQKENRYDRYNIEYPRPYNAKQSDRLRNVIEGTLTRPESLQEHLLWQLRLQPISSSDFQIGERLIRNLDHKGFYLSEPASLFHSIDSSHLNALIALIQTFEPIGSCVANYQESLLAQMDFGSKDPPPYARDIVANSLTDLEKDRHDAIMRKYSIDKRELDAIIDYIRELSPFPGLQYTADNAQYVIPDLQFSIRDGDVAVSLNDEDIPQLQISQFYEHLSMRSKSKNEITSPVQKRALEFASPHIQEARWLIDTIKRRNNTLLSAAVAIAYFQREFFFHGQTHLVPLVRKDIADAINVHPTTISRIATSKYAQTDWGIYELKYFFSTSASTKSSSNVSRKAVQAIVGKLLDSNRKKQLSDQKICDILQQRHGIKIARRTLAKYRAELNIESSYKRK